MDGPGEARCSPRATIWRRDNTFLHFAMFGRNGREQSGAWTVGGMPDPRTLRFQAVEISLI